jgi:hypothetical protein
MVKRRVYYRVRGRTATNVTLSPSSHRNTSVQGTGREVVAHFVQA